MTLVASWLALFAIFVGLGAFGRRLFGLGTRSPAQAFGCFWLGWAFSVVGLLLWHFAFPINPPAFWLTVALGLAGLVWNRQGFRFLVAALWRREKIFLGAVLVLGFGLALKAGAPVRDYDTGLYTLGTLKWTTAHPIVPGLGNLHGRFAFNSVSLLYAALLRAGPWEEPAPAVANGLLLFAVLAQSLRSVIVLLGAAFRKEKCSTADLFLSVFLGSVVTLVLSKSFPGYSTDIPAFLLGIVISHQLLVLLRETEVEGKEFRFRLFLIATLATVGCAVKLSQAAFCATALVLAFLPGSLRFLARDRRGWTKTTASLAAWCLVISLGWVASNVVLSGYLAYPGAYGPVDVEWRVPRPLALSEALLITGWARKPGYHWDTVLDNWDWLGHWFVRLPATATRPFLLAVLLLAYAAIRRWKGDRPPGYLWLLAIPPSASLAFCFFTAPDPRFAGASFAVLVSTGAALALPTRPRAAAVLFLALSALTVFLPKGRPVSYETMPQPEVETRVTESGLRVRVPVHEIDVTPDGLRIHVPVRVGQCWDTPQPCTPYFRPNLRLRDPERPGRGFVLDPGITFADLEGALPRGFTVSPDLGLAWVSGWHEIDDPEGPGQVTLTETGRLVVYTERAVPAKLKLSICGLRKNDEPVQQGVLRSFLNGNLVQTSGLMPEQELEIPLDLRRDFNSVALELLGTEESVPESKVRHWMTLTLCSADVTSE